MITFNIFSVTTFQDLLEKILEWREKYNGKASGRWQRVHFDTPYLKEPLQYDINILPKEQYLPYMEKHLQFIKNNVSEGSKTQFSELEFEKFRRVVDYMKATEYDDKKILEGRRDFWNFFNEQDRRRSNDFKSTFPEMNDFFELCRQAANG
jgi:hypothetical protein